MPVNLFSEATSFTLSHKKQIITWISKIIRLEGFDLKDLNIIFCSDNYLLELNKTYLNRDYYTDILTFDHSDDEKTIEGDLYISVDRIQENSKKFNKDFENELYRVMIHGVLHLLGYDDSTENERENMRKKEEACLSLHKRST